MNMIMQGKRWVIWAAVIAPFVLAVPVASAGSTELDARAATPLVLSGSTQNVFIRVALTGMAPRPGLRAPINVAIVLDRSGSMQGRKLAEAKRAAILAMDRLRNDDILSVITYESTVRVLVPATKLHDRASVRRAIQGIRSAGNTALFAGVSKGAQEVRKFIDDNRVNLVILLSDGLANVGPSSPGALAQLGASLGREGISVTTIGLGLDYNEDLMTRLAFRSDGNHFFVENAEDLVAAYASEFGDALSVVATDVDIWIRCHQGVRPVRVLGREAEIDGRNVYASMNQLFRDQTRYLILEVEVPAGYTGQVRRLVDVETNLVDLVDGGQVLITDRVSVRYTDSPALVERSIDRTVMASVAGQLGVERAEMAMKLRDAGKVKEAQAMFEQNSAILKQQAERYEDDSLLRDSVSNYGFSQSLSDEDYGRSRKEQQEYLLKSRQQRVVPESGKEEKKD
jgi:Ca-activated chloride channel family protein